MNAPHISIESLSREVRHHRAKPFFWNNPAEITNTRDLRITSPEPRRYVVEGLVRRGETFNIIAAPKIGKSLLVLGLAWSVETGQPWLGHKVEQGRVLIIDNELHGETLSDRCERVAIAMGVDQDRFAIDIMRLRGHSIDINSLRTRLDSITHGTYQLVVLDALYRFLPPGCSESDNSGMMQVYNRLDSYAEQLNAAIAVVHHSSKGSQGEKSVSDVGSGAGVVSRAADSHIVLRPHATPELVVLEALTRSYQQPEPKSLRLNFPLWSVVDDEPVVKKATDRSATDRKADLKDMNTIFAKVPTSGMILQARLVEQSPFGESKSRRLIGQMVTDKLLTRIPITPEGAKRELIHYERNTKDHADAK